MTDDQFNACRIFLESQIEKFPEKEKLVDAYIRLIEVRGNFDIEEYKAFHARLAKELEAIRSSRAESDKAYYAARAKETEARELTEREKEKKIR